VRSAAFMNRVVLPPAYSTDDMDAALGTWFQPDDTWVRIDDSYQNVDVYREDGTVIAKLRRDMVDDSLSDLGVDCYKRVGQMVSSNRGHAAGLHVRERTHDSYEKGAKANTGIIGYIDNTNLRRPCRLTQFTKQHFATYSRGLPFVHRINRCFAEVMPEEYRLQRAEAQKTGFHIEDTAFSTVTVNYNFRTTLHKDSGDFRRGFGNLVVCQRGVSGGELLFPRYKLAIGMRTGDFLAMDVHEYKCHHI
jgi:hypothetical protein